MNRAIYCVDVNEPGMACVLILGDGEHEPCSIVGESVEDCLGKREEQYDELIRVDKFTYANEVARRSVIVRRMAWRG